MQELSGRDIHADRVLSLPDLDLIPVFGKRPSMISDEGRVAHSFAWFANEWGTMLLAALVSVRPSRTSPAEPRALHSPTGLKRYYGAKHLHFIAGSCYHRWPRLGATRRRDRFLKVLEEARQRYRFVVVGYVIMPEHFHLLISEPEIGDPSVVMKVVKERFARPVRRGGASKTQLGLWPDADQARIWQRRFHDFNVWSERKRLEKLRYIHRNPVKRGLVSEPDQWAWSRSSPRADGERWASRPSVRLTA